MPLLADCGSVKNVSMTGVDYQSISPETEEW